MWQIVWAHPHARKEAGTQGSKHCSISPSKPAKSASLNMSLIMVMMFMMHHDYVPRRYPRQLRHVADLLVIHSSEEASTRGSKHSIISAFQQTSRRRRRACSWTPETCGILLGRQARKQGSKQPNERSLMHFSEHANEVGEPHAQIAHDDDVRDEPRPFSTTLSITAETCGRILGRASRKRRSKHSPARHLPSCTSANRHSFRCAPPQVQTYF